MSNQTISSTETTADLLIHYAHLDCAVDRNVTWDDEYSSAVEGVCPACELENIRPMSWHDKDEPCDRIACDRLATRLTLALALQITERIAPSTTWSNDNVVIWDYVGGDGGVFLIVRTTSAWDAARNKGAGKTIGGIARVALPAGIDPNNPNPPGGLSWETYAEIVDLPDVNDLHQATADTRNIGVTHS